MADLNKQEKPRKKRTYSRKVKSAKTSVNINELDSQRLTDDNGRLKFIKQSKYLETLTQGED